MTTLAHPFPSSQINQIPIFLEITNDCSFFGQNALSSFIPLWWAVLRIACDHERIGRPVQGIPVSISFGSLLGISSH
jgi:hypothetical protein